MDDGRPEGRPAGLDTTPPIHGRERTRNRWRACRRLVRYALPRPSWCSPGSVDGPSSTIKVVTP